MKSLRFWVVVVFVLLAMPSLVRAGAPTDQLRASIVEFVAILSNTPVAELLASGLPESARRLVFARFDFPEMTKRSLGSHWKSLDQGEQGEFVEAFTQRLLVAYGKTNRQVLGSGATPQDERPRLLTKDSAFQTASRALGQAVNL